MIIFSPKYFVLFRVLVCLGLCICCRVSEFKTQKLTWVDRGKWGPGKLECNETEEGVNFVLGMLAGEASCALLPGIRSHIVNSLPCVPLRIKF